MAIKDKIPTLEQIKAAFDVLVKKSDVVNNLTTTVAGKVLDARQGKALSDAIAQSTANMVQRILINVWTDESVEARSKKYKWVNIASRCPTGYSPIAITLECNNVNCVANVNDGISVSPYLDQATICVHNVNSNNTESVTVNMIATLFKNT